MNIKLRYIISCICLSLSIISCKKHQETSTLVHHTVQPKEVLVSTDLLSERLQILEKDSLQTTFKNKDSIIAFYKLRNGKSAWNVLKNRIDLYQSIKKADLEGLRSESYQVKTIEKIINNDPFAKADNIYIDLLFTDIYLAYAYHLANGKVDHQKLHNDWVLQPNSFSFNMLLSNAIDRNEVSKSFNTFKPSHKIYQQLKNILPKYKTLINTDSLRTLIADGDKIRPNKSDDRIITIRKRLNELGFLQDSLVNDSKILDTLLQEQVKKFQASKKLQTDAIIGKGTIKALNESYEDQYHSILANLERWRWFPRNFNPNAIVVNIPNYNLNYITHNDTINYNIIVGRTDRKTPVFSSQVRYLEFNPKWFIPPTIKNKDIIPAIRKNTGYLIKKNISVFNKQGERIHPDSVEWNSNIVSSYRYVQSSGNSNALGRVKIIFPNDFSVYLHDTPSKSLFKKNYRARSSGCVRVQNPFDLTHKLLKSQEHWTKAEIDSTLARRITKRVHVNQKIEVHFLYWSILFNEKNQQPEFINDVYDLDYSVAKAVLN